MTSKFFDIYPLCEQLANTESSITASLDYIEIMVQVFEGSHLFDEDAGLLAAFKGVSDGTALTTMRAIGMPGFLAEIGRALFCYGNVGLVQNSTKLKNPRFHLVDGDYKNRDKYGEKFDDVVGYSLRFLSRDKRLSSDPEYGEPYLMPAIATYIEMSKIRDADFEVLDDLAAGTIDPYAGAMSHESLYARTRLLREQVIDLAGLELAEQGLHLIKPHVRRMLADDTKKLFVEFVLEPYRQSIGASRAPRLIVPIASDAGDMAASWQD